MFESLEMSEKHIVYQALLCLIKSNSGVGFHNGDQGNAAYRVGAKGTIDYAAWGDSPDHNRLFKMMHTLAVELCQGDPEGKSEIGEWIYSWSDFCRTAVESYDRERDRNR
jgi:hypothetical protein